MTTWEAVLAVRLAGITVGDPTSGGNVITRYAMWFAWHAMYPDDKPVQ